MSFKKYRAIDLSIFLILYVLFEFLIIKAATTWFKDEPFSVSLMLPMLLLIIMRWDKFSFIHAILFALFFVFASSFPGNLKLYIIYLVGNLGLMLILLFVKKIGKTKIVNSFWLTFLYVVIGFILMEVFRGITAFFFEGFDFKLLYQYIFTDALSLVFSLVVILICRKIKGLFIDQKTYLIELQKEKEKEN